MYVCCTTFVGIYCVGSKRLKNIVSHKWSTNNPRSERRGGAWESITYNEIQEQIKTHILSFRCVSSHYGRTKTPHREYLASTLSVSKMYKLFKEHYDGEAEVGYN